MKLGRYTIKEKTTNKKTTANLVKAVYKWRGFNRLFPYLLAYERNSRTSVSYQLLVTLCGAGSLRRALRRSQFCASPLASAGLLVSFGVLWFGWLSHPSSLPSCPRGKAFRVFRVLLIAILF